jgi:hypothetical protein
MYRGRRKAGAVPCKDGREGALPSGSTKVDSTTEGSLVGSKWDPQEHEDVSRPVAASRSFASVTQQQSRWFLPIWSQVQVLPEALFNNCVVLEWRHDLRRTHRNDPPRHHRGEAGHRALGSRGSGDIAGRVQHEQAATARATHRQMVGEGPAALHEEDAEASARLATAG